MSEMKKYAHCGLLAENAIRLQHIVEDPEDGEFYLAADVDKLITELETRQLFSDQANLSNCAIADTLYAKHRWRKWPDEAPDRFGAFPVWVESDSGGKPYLDIGVFEPRCDGWYTNMKVTHWFELPEVDDE